MLSKAYPKADHMTILKDPRTIADVRHIMEQTGTPLPHADLLARAGTPFAQARGEDEPSPNDL